MSGNKFKFVGAVAVLLEQGDQVLLIRRYNTGFADGMYCMPTGHVDGRESFVDAAIREAREEIGVDIVPEDMELFHMSHNMYGSTLNECITFFFKAKTWQGVPFNNEPHKCDDVSWFDKDKLPDSLLLNFRDAIEADEGQVTHKTYPLKQNVSMLFLTKQRNNKLKP